MKTEWKLLKKWISESDNIVFLGGAGVSTESGIPDFRGKNGLYRQERKIPLEKVLSHDFFMEHPEVFYKFYRESAPSRQNVKPNITHYKLAELEKEGKLKAIITQNADGLHQAAGSKVVYELHGNGNNFYCVKCGKNFSVSYIQKSKEAAPHCDCGGLIRPAAVFFGESLNPAVIQNSMQAIQKADLLIVGGTSLVVYPEAGFINYFSGPHLVLINQDPTPYDTKADLLIQDKLGDVFAVI